MYAEFAQAKKASGFKQADIFKFPKPLAANRKRGICCIYGNPISTGQYPDALDMIDMLMRNNDPVNISDSKPS
jgi:hypothetical protein